MSISEDFRTFLDNIKIDNQDQISDRYGEITYALNKEFRDTTSRTANSLQVGSYGRRTAIKGVSDLDMVFEVPESEWGKYQDGGQGKLLTRVKEAILQRYPSTSIKVDSPVVRVLYSNFHIEVLPGFKDEDGHYKYPDTSGSGSWKHTKPRLELEAMKEANQQKNDNLRRLCKMVRAWKNKHGQQMGGLLIDTLAHNFLNSTGGHGTTTYKGYPEMACAFFDYLANQPDQSYYLALGSKQQVKVKRKFQKKAAKAANMCRLAVEAAGQKNERQKWRDVFGNSFPAPPKSQTAKSLVFFKNTEEFINDWGPIDIQHTIRIDCEVRADGFRARSLRDMNKNHEKIRTRNSLKFYVKSHNLPDDCEIFWKVLNRGTEAERRNDIRGQIHEDGGHLERTERSSFKGEHLVECYAMSSGVTVARDSIRVPIGEY